MTDSDNPKGFGFAPLSRSELASFIVEFSLANKQERSHELGRSSQYITRVHQLENGDSEEWDGLATVELAQWISKSVARRIIIGSDSPFPIKRPFTAEISLNRECNELRGLSLSVLDKSSRFLGLHISDDLLNLDFRVRVRDLVDDHSNINPVPVGLYINGYRLDGDELIELDSFNFFATPKQDFSLHHLFSDIKLSRGFYRLFGLAVIYLDPPLLVSSEGHLIQIV